MYKYALAAISCLTLTACGDGQPFTFGAVAPDGTEEPLDPLDPNVSVESIFAYDTARGLTMNSVEYDAKKDDLVINNLPFDGPRGRYDRISTLSSANGNVQVYASRRTETTGQIQHYAVFVKSDHLSAVAANGAEWTGYGYGGANVRRDEFSLPSDGVGEYVFIGHYGGVRVFDDRGRLELVNGDVRILLDVLDFDPVDGIQGAITGRVFDRTITTVAGQDRQDLPDMLLAVTSFSTTDGTWTEGEATTYDLEGDQWSTGSFEGMLAGIDSTELGANVVIEGVAYKQRISYEIVTYEVTTETPVNIGGIEIIQTRTSRGTAEGLTINNRDDVQLLVDRGVDVPYLVANPVDIPEGAKILSRETETADFQSDFNAREIGAIVSSR